LLKLTGFPNAPEVRFEVEAFFSKFGKVKHCDSGKTNPEFVVVRFDDEEVAKEALKNITNDNKQIQGVAVTASMITGEEEQNYWTSYIIGHMKESGRGRGRGRGGRGRGGRGKRGKF